jgi:membrane-associated protease RseP (regulator of RpoE activity)
MVLTWCRIAGALIALGGAARVGAQAPPLPGARGGARDGSPASAGPRPLLYGFALECARCRWTREPGNPRPIWEYGEPPMVAAITPGGAAARAGIQVGDTLTAVDGLSILSSEGSRRLSFVRLGDRVSLTLRRSGEATTKSFALGPPFPPPAGDTVVRKARIGSMGVVISSEMPVRVTADSTGTLIITLPAGSVRVRPDSAAESQRQRRKP